MKSILSIAALVFACISLAPTEYSTAIFDLQASDQALAAVGGADCEMTKKSDPEWCGTIPNTDNGVCPDNKTFTSRPANQLKNALKGVLKSACDGGGSEKFCNSKTWNATKPGKCDKKWRPADEIEIDP